MGPCAAPAEVLFSPLQPEAFRTPPSGPLVWPSVSPPVICALALWEHPVRSGPWVCGPDEQQTWISLL